jgi:putative transposase
VFDLRSFSPWGDLANKWYMDEVFIRIKGVQHYLWRAVDQDGVVLDILVQARRDAQAAERFFKRLLKGPRRRPAAVASWRRAPTEPISE